MSPRKAAAEGVTSVPGERDPRDGTMTREKPDAVHPWVKNPKKRKSVAKIVTSLLRFNWGRPMVANCRPGLEGELIIGHGTFQALQHIIKIAADPKNRQRAKAKAVLDRGIPIFWRDLPAAEAHALALVDNRSAEDAEWDNDLLAEVFQTESFDAETLFATGFDSAEIEKFMFGGAEEERGASQLSGDLVFQVVVTCEDEAQQTELIERLELEGFNCKPLMT